MPFDANERTVAMWQQTSLESLPADWDADPNVRVFLCTEPNVEGVGRGINPNNNYKRRAFATRPSLRALRNGEFSMGVYLSGLGAVTGSNAQAATFALPELMRNAWGGLLRGYAAGVDTPSTSAPVVTAGHEANLGPGQWVFGVNSATGRGQFCLIDDIAAQALNLRTHATADIDVAGAVIINYLHTRALTQRHHAGHITHALYVRGEGDDDNFILIGCKLTLSSLDNMEAGQEPVCQFSGMCTDFRKESVTRAALSATPEGPAPITVGTGANTSVRWANVGTPDLTDMEAYAAALTPGVTQNPVSGFGREGRLGYHAGGYDDTVLEVTVPYDEAHIADFEAGTEKHVLVQLGDQQGAAAGLYLPRCVIDEDPRRGNTAEETSMLLKFKALEYEGATALTGDAYELWRSKVQLLLSA